MPQTLPPAAPASYPPINFIYAHFHNAIRAELDALAALVRSLEAPGDAGIEGRLQELKDSYRFLEQVYKYHSAVEDEVRRCGSGGALLPCRVDVARPGYRWRGPYGSATGAHVYASPPARWSTPFWTPRSATSLWPTAWSIKTRCVAARAPPGLACLRRRAYIGAPARHPPLPAPSCPRRSSCLSSYRSC